MRLAVPVLSMAAATTPSVTNRAGMPPMMYGTAWKKERTASLVTEAIKAGFTGIDTACQPKHYKEEGVGEAVSSLIEKGIIKRGDIFIQTKYTPIRGQDPKNIPYDPSKPLATQVAQSFARSQQNLRTDYVDSLVLHSPLPTIEETLTVWREFEKLHASRCALRLGISNCYDPSFFRELYEGAATKPTVLQNRFYGDTGHDVELRAFCAEKGIAYQSFWTLTANKEVLRSRELKAIAAAHPGATPECVLYCALMQRGVTPLSGTCDAAHMAQDVAAMRGAFELSEDEVETIFRVVLSGRG